MSDEEMVRRMRVANAAEELAHQAEVTVTDARDVRAERGRIDYGVVRTVDAAVDMARAAGMHEFAEALAAAVRLAHTVRMAYPAGEPTALEAARGVGHLSDDNRRLRLVLTPFAAAYDAMRPAVQGNLARDFMPPDVHADQAKPARLAVHHLREASLALAITRVLP